MSAGVVMDGGDLIFRVVLDDSTLPAAAAHANRQLQQAANGAQVGARGFQQLTRSTQLSAQQMQQLSFQTHDFLVQIASGQSPLTAFVQQGSQLAGTFGGAGNAFRAVMSLLTPVRLLIGGVAVAMGGAALAAIQGYRESLAFGRAMQTTGNFAGQTAGQVNVMARSLAEAAGGPIAEAREALMGLVETGQVGPRALQPMAQAVLALARATGQSAAEATKQLLGLATTPARAVAEMNRSMHFLTLEQYRYIKSLDDAGRKEEAMRVASQALSKALAERKPELGLLERAWQGVKTAASDAWDAMLGIGRAETIDDKIRELEERLRIIQQGAGIGARGGRRQSTTADLAGGVQEQLRELRRLQEATQANARARAKAAADAQRAIELEEQRERAKDARFGRLRAEGGLATALAEEAIESRRLALERQFERLEISSLQAAEKRVAIERDAFAQRERAVLDDMALESRRGPGKTAAEREQHLTRMAELQTKLVELSRERERLEDRIARGEFFKAGPSQESAQEAFRRRELEQTEEVNRELAERQGKLYADMRKAAEDFHKGFVDTGRDAFAEWVRTGKVSAESLVDFIKTQFARLFYDRFLAATMNSVAGSIFAAIGLGGPAGAVDAGPMHTGGIAGATADRRRVSPLAFAGAPRMHLGGIAGDEVPTILRRGEEVLTERDPRHRRNGGGINLTVAPVIHPGVSRNEVVNGMHVAVQRAVAEVADLRRRGNSAFVGG